MAQIVWTEPALEDLKNIVEYVSRDSRTYAERLATRIVESPRRLQRFPHSGRVIPEFSDKSIKELMYGSYRIIYLVKGDTCYVTAVVHGSRDVLRRMDPGDWEVT